MPNPFIDYIVEQIRTNPVLSQPNQDGAGKRARVFDNIPLSGDREFGKEAQAFLKQATSLYKRDVFKPPYSKENIDVLHDILMKLNTDVEREPTWALLEKELKAQNPALTSEDISRMQIQFLSAYRYKVLSRANAILQAQYPDRKLEIISVAGPLLQNVNVLIKDDAKMAHRNKEELLRDLIKDSQKELTVALTGKNSFSEFSGTKTLKLMDNLGPSGFDMVFKHFNASNRTLTHENPSLASTDQIQKFCNYVLAKCSEDKEFRKYISEDPAAFVFLQKAKQALEQAKVNDPALLKFMGNVIDKSQYSSNNLLSQLKAVEKKLDKGDLKEKVATMIKTLEHSPNLDKAVIDDLKRIKLQSEVMNYQSAKANPALEGLKVICESYIQVEKLSKPAPMLVTAAAAAAATVTSSEMPSAASAAAAAVSSETVASMPAHKERPAPLIFHAPQASVSVEDAQTKTPKQLFADVLTDIATEMHALGRERDESLLSMSEQVNILAQRILSEEDPAMIDAVVERLKNSILQLDKTTQAAASRELSIDVTKINEDIGKAYTQFQESLQSEGVKPKAAKPGI